MEKDVDEPSAAAATVDLMEQVAAADEEAEVNTYKRNLNFRNVLFGMKYHECDKWDDQRVPIVIHGVRQRAE